jgi:hypothetical protein
MIAFGLDEGIAADWPRLHLSYRDIVAAIPRTASRLELEPIAVELAALAQEVRKALESHVKTEEPSPMGLIPCATYRIQIHTLMNLIPASKKAKGRPLR